MVASAPSPRRRSASALLAIAAAIGLLHIHRGSTFMLPHSSAPTASAISSRRNMLNGVVAIGAAAIPGSASAEGKLFTFDMPTSGPLSQFKAFTKDIPPEVSGFERDDGAQIIVGPIKTRGYIKEVRNARTGGGSALREITAAKESDGEDIFEFTAGTPVTAVYAPSSISALSKEGLPVTHWWYRILKVDNKEVAGIIIKVPMNGNAKFDEEKIIFDELARSLALV